MRIDEMFQDREPVFSFEFFPPKSEEGARTLFEAIATLAPLQPSFVSVTYGAGGSTREGTVEVSSRIHNEYGIETMTHLSCVGETREGLQAILDRLESEGIENILALRGDPPRGQKDFVQPEGGLSSAAELAGFISERFGFALGGSCFPEVHPEAADLDADLDYLKTKVDNGATFLITQLFFENQVYFDFVAAAREKGIDVPIVPGILPVISYERLVSFCEVCDASIPPRFAAAMEALGGEAEAEAELGIAYAARQCEELLAAGAPGVHFYTLNRAPATRAVLAALRVARPWDRASSEPVELPAS